MKQAAVVFPFTTIAIVLTVLVVAAAVFMDVNVVNLDPRFLQGIEAKELDEIFLSFLLVVVALATDHIWARLRRTRESVAEADRLRAIQATMRTVEEIVRDSISELQMLRMQAASDATASLRLFDDSIQRASSRMQLLEDLKVFADKTMTDGAGVGVAKDSKQ